jgi:HSP90 family molecular chaperone
MKGEKWDEEKKRAGRHRRGRDRQPGLGLWARSKNDITDEQYKEFYKHVGHDFEDPLAWTHARVEGKTGIHAAALRAGARALRPVGPQRPHGIKLYVRRVFIMDDAEQLMPPTCASCAASSIRPTCRSTSRARSCRNRRTSRRSARAAPKVLGLLDDMANSDDAAEKEKYAKFWGEFGKVLKEGMGEDHANKDKIAGLLRFASTHADTTDETVSLADYIGRMKAGAGKDLLRHRRDLQRGEEQPAPGSLPQEGHRGHPALRPRRRMGGVAPDRVRGQATGVGRQGRPRSRQAGRRGREEGTGIGSRRVQGPHREDRQEPRRARSRKCASRIA